MTSVPARERRLDPRRNSLRTRLTIWVVGIFVLIQTATGLGYWAYQQHASRRMFEAQLAERVATLAHEIQPLLPDLSRVELEDAARGLFGSVLPDRFEVDVLDEQGDSVVRDASIWMEDDRPFVLRPFSTDRPARARVDDGRGDPIEAISVPLTGGSRGRYVLVVAADDELVHRQLVIVARVLLIGGIFGIVASVVSGWFIAGIAVEPIRRVTRFAGQLSPETIDRALVFDHASAEVDELARQLDAARARIRAAFESQERFLSNISHELKTPIATLLLEAQTIDRASLPDDGRQFVETTEEEMRKLGRLVESFLMLTRVLDGAGLSAARGCVPNEIVMDSIDDCAAMAAQYGVRLDPELTDDPRGLEPTILGDGDLLRTMLDNLVRNAIRFSPREDVVDVRATVRDDVFEITVRDRGQGIAEEILDHVFDRFVRSGEHVSRDRGQGLGLAIAMGIAEMHHGDIDVANHPEGGAIFTVRLPLRRERDDADDGEGTDRPASERAGDAYR